MENNENELTLKVAKAYPNDTARGIARLDPDALLKLQLSPGGIVEILGKKMTAAKVWRADRQDWGQGYIRVDGFIRQNAGVGIGGHVTVTKAKEENATSIVLAPPEGHITIMPVAENFGENIKRQLVKKSVVKGDIVPIISTMMPGELMPLVAIETEPEGIVIVTEETKIELHEKPIKGYETVRATGITYEDIGGLRDEIQRVREMIEIPLKHPEVFQRMGIDPPKGILLYGPPGTGKTLIAKAVANESGASFFTIAGPEIMSKYYGESEQRLREIFDEARESAPSIIFIDEIDSIAPKREDVTGEVERRVVAQLLTIMDGMSERGQIVVIGATNRVDAIDPALRRPGRFDREIELGVPKIEDRLEILQIHTRNMPLADDVLLEDITASTHGFVGADLASLVREAAMRALRRYVPNIKLEEDVVPEDILESMIVEGGDFMGALKEVEPSAMREVIIDIPHVKWDDVGGMAEVKQALQESIEWPLKRPDSFARIGIKPPKGILLYGPPGTGKTLIAKAVATESDANFISVRGPELLSKWVGESEKAIREIFRKARQVAPAIIFFDEIDSLAPMRGTDIGGHVSERVVNQLLSEMDGLESLDNIVVIAATNRPDILDPALIRPGRFDRIIFVGMPSREDRLHIFKVYTKSMKISEDVSIEELADTTEGYVGSDIEAFCMEAGMLALREDIDAELVKFKHFNQAMEKIKPTITDGMIDNYKRMQEILKGGLSAEAKTRSYTGYI